MYKHIKDLHIYEDENTKNFYDINRNDTNDSFVNMILIYNKYYDDLCSYKINNPEIEALTRIICQRLEYIIDTWRDDLYDYIHELFDHVYTGPDFKYISSMFSYSKNIRFRLSEYDDEICKDFIRNKIYTDSVMEQIKDIVKEESGLINDDAKHDVKNIMSLISFDNIIDEDWLKTFIYEHTPNDISSRILTNIVFELNERKVDRYGY